MNRRVSINDHADFLTGLLTPSDHDDIDDMLDEEIVMDPYNREPSSRRSDKEISKLLDILDNLPTGKDADER
jgi:hypothetical protein